MSNIKASLMEPEKGIVRVCGGHGRSKFRGAFHQPK